jgi:Ca2+-binding RTX toxin-like protein
MALPIGLNDLAKLTLLASDASYFDPTDPNPEHRVDLGSPLAYLKDTSYGVTPQYNNVPSGYFAIDQWVDKSTGLGVIVYKKDGATPAETKIIVAFRGTDGPDPQDWVANSQYLGWNQWNSPIGRARVFNLIDSLRSDPSTPGTAFEGTIHFTGQSLGGGLAQYAAYEYVQSHQGLTGFSKSNITLTTFNGFGGVLGLQQNIAGGYQSSVLTGIGSNAHFYTEGDLVSRLGSLNGVGHTGGTTYFLNAHAREIDPDTGEPFLLNFVDAHRIETGFYPFLTPGVEFEAAVARPIDYLSMQNVQQIAALYGRIGNDQDVSPRESIPRLAAGLIAGLSLGNPSELNALVQAVLTNFHSAGQMTDEWYVCLREHDWGAIARNTAIAFPQQTAGAYAVSLLAAMLSDALELADDQRGLMVDRLQDWVSSAVQAVDSGVPPEDRRAQMDMLFSLIPGAAIGSKLAPVLQPLAVDVEELAQSMIASGADWVSGTLKFLREKAQGVLADTEIGGFIIKLASTFADVAFDCGMTKTAVQGYLDSVIVPMIRDIANGTANAVSTFVQDIPNTLFNFGRPISNLADIQLIDQAYAAELNDPRLSSSIRAAAVEARQTIRRAGQTVVLSTGRGVNPFKTPGFVPGGASSAMVEERLGQTFRLSLPFATGAGGQRILLQLQGPQANQLSVLTENGAQAIGANGTFELRVPEGADQIYFTLNASDGVSSNATVTLSATLVDTETGVATHTTQVESVVNVNAFVGNTDPYYGEYIEDYSGLSLDDYPSDGTSLPMGAGGHNHLLLIGGPGPEFMGWFNGFGDDRMYGNGGDDFLDSRRGNDILYGGDGDDRLIADSLDDDPLPVPNPTGPTASSQDGKDFLDGGNGNDLLAGGGNADRLIGGAGDDFLWGDAYTTGLVEQHPDGSQTLIRLTGVLRPGDDVLEGGEGNDYLSGDGGDDSLDGGAGDDVLWGDNEPGLNLLFPMAPGNDFLSGGGGNDELSGGAGEDVLLGGSGNDLLFGDDEGVGVALQGDDWLEGGDGDDQLSGRGGNDTLLGGTGLDVLFGGDGNDALDGDEGDDGGYGGAGDDEIVAGAGADQFDGEAGDDLLIGEEGNDLLIGGAGIDTLDGGADDDLLLGGAGADTVFGGSGSDELQGGLDNDFLSGDEGDDRLFGQEGGDELFGGDGNDGLRGEDGADQLDGGAGDDTLVGDGDGQIGGAGGSDVLIGGAGNDTLVGGGGQDTYRFDSGDGFDVIVDAAGEGNRLVFGAGISPSVIVAAVGPNDTLVVRTGNGGDAVQIQNFGTNNVAGPHPIDSFEFSDGTILTYAQLTSSGIGISGGAGSDALTGTALNDRMFGGPERDMIYGLDGADTLLGEDGADRLEGGAGSDVLLGGIGDDIIVGGSGDDRLVGGTGFDILFGEEGSDTLEGSGGDDSLDGGDGNDALAGGRGNDQLSGGAGNDEYRFTLGDGVDVVFDSGPATDIDRVVFGSGITSGTLSLTTTVGQILIKVGTGSDGMVLGSGADVFESQSIEELQFVDGTVLSYAQLMARGFDIDGTAGDDFLIGTNVVDRFRGGLGNDRLEGGTGNDSYYFNAGDGIDTIVDTASVGAGNEVVFGAGITSADLSLDLAPDQSDSSRSDLLIRVGTNGDAIQLDTFDRSNALGARTVETFRFADGSTLTYDQVLASGFDLTGTDGDDQITGTNVVDRIVAGDGADVLRSGLGDDTLDGGLGNDRLLGGQGSDTYLFGPGSGQDTIIESQGSLDTIRLAPGVAPSDVVVTRSYRDLVLSLNGGADRLTVSLYFLAAPLQIERVQFADGTIWDQAFLENLTQPAITGTGGSDALTGTSGDDRLLGLAGDDQLVGLAGHDRLDGGTGADQLTGRAGDDTYFVDNAGDVVTELVNEGRDTVLSAVSTQLSANVENLTLTGNTAIDGTGNELDNVLTGNSAANVLTGGVGNDTYVVSAGDTVVELAGEGTDTVEAGISTTLGANVENLTLTGSASLIGTGNALDNILQADGSISILAGGDGNDTYLIGADGGDDILVETATGGTDTVIATHDYRLPDHIENLMLLDPRVPDFSNLSLSPYAPYGPWVRTAGYGNDLNNTLIGGRANNLLDGGLGADTLIGGAGDDTYLVDQGGDVVSELSNEGTDTIESSVTYTLSANVENLILTGAASVNGTGNTLNNDIRGNTASNILDGGAGDDSLQGFGGADTYLFGRGSGRDIVFDSSVTGEIETIQLAVDLAPSDIEVYRREYGLVLVIAGSTDELTLASFFDQPEYAQKQVRFADGTVWSENELRTRAVTVGGTVAGTAGDDTLTGSAGHDVLSGSAGNDLLTGGLGNDWLYGDATSQSPFGPQVIGNDTLIGGAGDDILIDLRGANVFDGGSGNDMLYLGTGQDTVLFGRGSGLDAVTLDTNENDLDIIRMGTDILPSDVSLTRSIQRASGANVIDLTIPSTGDRLTVTVPYVGIGSEMSPQAVVLFADGTRWDLVWMPTESSSSGADLLEVPSPRILAGLSGDDTYLMGSSGISGTYGVIEASGGGIDTVESLIDYVLDQQVENLILLESASSMIPNPERGSGNELDNLIVGNSGDNILDGGAGNDILVGGVIRELEGPPYLEGTGSDILIGGAGDDVLMADAGDLVSNGEWLFLGGGLTSRDVSVIREADDLFIGGVGNDTYIVHSQQQTIAEFSNEGTDTVKSTVSYTLGENLENLTLVSPPLRFDYEDNAITSAPLNGTGNGLDNLIIGSGDDNVLSGLAGSDTLWGGNVVDPDSGSARSGNDTLLGGAGSDTYLFNLGDGIDTIEDVATLGEGNRIQFGAGVSRSDLTFTEDTDARTLTIQVGTGGTDQLVLTNFDATSINGSLVVETLAFADGSSVSLASLLGPSITIFGTEDAEVLVGTVEHDGIDAGAGNDTVYAGAGDDLILAGAGDDVVAGEAGADTIYGGAGVDYLYGGDGADVINGDEGDDVLVGEADDDTLIGGLGNDVLNGGIGNDHLIGGDGVDTIYAGVGDDLIEAGDGNDAVVGEEGADAIYGGAGADYLYGGDGDDLVNGDEGSDVLVGEAGNDTLNGGLGDDVLNGGDGEDVLSGEAGNDAFYAGAGNDLISGGEGDDSVSGEDGADAISGGVGTDYLYGGTGDDQIQGDEGNDTLVGEDGLDVLAGGAGNDVLNGGIGADQLYGGDGDDSLYIDAVDTVVSGGDGYDVVVVTGVDGVTFGAAGTGIELMAGSVGNDVLTAVGSANSITFYGGEGTDQLIGGNANDVLVGDGGDDLLSGGDGNDVLNGGVGDDTLTGGAGDDAFYAGTGNDLISGGDGTDSVSGDEGNDVIAGGADGDYLYGGTGDDVINGDAGNDVLVGEADNDTLAGGAGKDRLVGGVGNDVYRFGAGGGSDVIAENDSTSGNQDLLQFDSDMTPLDLVLSQQANDLRIAIHGTAEQILLENWFLGEGYQVETIEAGAGVTLLSSQVDQLIQAMAGFSQQSGLTWDQAIDQRPQDVQTVLAASWH